MSVGFVCSLLLSFVLTAIIARKFIPVLKSIKMGQKILDIGPRWHKSKEGTPYSMAENCRLLQVYRTTIFVFS